ncbi:MAG: hypothetical protein F6K44_32385, partial [Moorea sp. SIO3E2]|nr:hypothetical protein [Moorena sp. SIO3E2]
MKIAQLEYFELQATDHPILGGFVFTTAEAFAGPGIGATNAQADALAQHTDTSVESFIHVDEFFSEARAKAEARARDRHYWGYSVHDPF